MTLRKFLVIIMAMACIAANSANYLVSTSATTAGATITHKGQTYTVGTTAFASIKALMAASPAANSTVNVLAGTYADNVTINVAGLTFLGPNAYIDKRAQTRNSNAAITGVITVNADNTTINGFYIKESGQIKNTAATNTAPLSGFTFIYNVVNNPSVARDANGSNAVILLGTPVSNANANADSSQKRYQKVTIAHNIFSKNEGTTDPAWVTISGGYGSAMKIIDNKFTEGGTAINICNSRGTYDILNNNFAKIGNNNINETTKGDFAIRLYRNAYAGTTVFNIKNNDFNNCSGQQTLYPCIRFYCGTTDSENFVTPKNCSVNLNYNSFRSKTQIHADYNYVYYIDAAATNAVKHDVRFNTFDNSYYAIAKTNSVYDTTNLGYRFGDNTGLITPSKATFGTWRGATSLGAVTIIQSWDIDDETGDIYTVQVMGDTEKAQFKSTYGDPSGLKLTRLNSSGTIISKMNVVYAGHGSQMSVGRIGGKVYVFLGGKAALNSSGTEMISHAVTWFPWVGGATVNCNGSTTFTYSSKTYDIKYFHPDGLSGSNDYPAVDNENRLFCTRTSSSNYNYYWVYDLDDVIANGTNATPLRKLTVTKKTDPTSVSGDSGYNTWDHQGYCIHGDYIYMLEGVSRVNAAAVSSKPTVFFHVYNWRTKAFAYRQQVTNSTLNGLSNLGEPEGCKVHRASDGHANLIFAMADGAVGARKAYFYKLVPKKETYTLPSAAATVNKESLEFSSATLTAVSKTVKLTNTCLTGDWTFTLSGANATNFSVSSTSATPLDATTTVTVTYTPTADAATHTGYLRCSSPLLTDIVIPLTGTYSGYSPTEPAITASPTSASLSAVVNTTATKAITITGANLSSGIALALSGTNAAMFSLSTSSLGTSGGSVTVTYAPTTEGSHSATLTATSGTVSTTVALTGTSSAAPVPTITASAASLSFSAEAESTATKSVTFTGANLTGNISLALSGANASQFSLSASSLGTSGGSVTVTYAPTAAGSHSATLTASSSGAASVTVALNGTATAKPAVDPSQFVFTKIVETSSNIVESNDGRFSTGHGGFVYVTDKANGIIYKYDSNGNRSAAFSGLSGIGTAITSDDAGNLLVNKGFPNATSGSEWMIIEPNGTTHDLSLTYPSGVTAARTDAVGRVVGNMMSAAGAYVCIIPNGATSGALFKIANGAVSGSATAIDAGLTANATTIAQPVATTVAAVAANPASAFAFRNRVDKQVVTKAFTRTSADGFDVFTLGSKTYLIEPSGASNYGDGYTIHELGNDEVLAERAETVTDGALKYQSITARVSDDGTYATIYQNVSGKLVSIYRYGMPPTGVETVGNDAVETAHVYYNLQGVRIERPAAGQIAIRVATMSDGSVRTSKVVVR